MKNIILILAVAMALSSCTDKGKTAACFTITKEVMDSLRGDLMKTDIAFSEMSEQKGQNVAFAEYAADNATILRPYSMPVTGKDSIMHMFSAHPDSTRKLTWTPSASDVAISGEIGFTYGTYILLRNGKEKEEGTYCTVWHKNKDKKWKFLVDTGNEGLNAADKAEDMAEEKAKEEKK
jgi:ketosteroid isomerase-like protein